MWKRAASWLSASFGLHGMDNFSKVDQVDTQDQQPGGQPKTGYEHLATAAHFAAASSTTTNVNVCTTDDFTKSVDALVDYIDPDNEETKIAYPTPLFDLTIADSRNMMFSLLTLAIGNNQGNLTSLGSIDVKYCKVLWCDVYRLLLVSLVTVKVTCSLDFDDCALCDWLSFFHAAWWGWKYRNIRLEVGSAWKHFVIWCRFLNDLNAFAKVWAMSSTARSTTSTCLQHSWGCAIVPRWMWRTCGASWAVAPPTVALWLAPSSSPSWVCSPSLWVTHATLSGREATSSRTMSPRATRCSARWMSAFLRWWRPWGPVSRRLAAPSSSLPTSLQMILRRWLPVASTSFPSSVLCPRTSHSWLMAMLQAELQWPAAGATSPSSSCTTTGAGHGSVTSPQTQRGYTAFVHTKISRVIVAMSFGKMEGDASDNDEADGLYYRQEWQGMKETTPIISGGMNALRLPAFFENLGHSNVILSGDGSFHHKDGPKIGAISCRQGEEAWKQWKAGQFGNISLSDLFRSRSQEACPVLTVSLQSCLGTTDFESDRGGHTVRWMDTI